MEKLVEISKHNYESGYSCSESIVKAAVDIGLMPESCLPLATAFSGGMSSGCLCGAVAGAQMVIGAMYGRTKERDGMEARQLAKRFVEEFKSKRKFTCCKALTAGLEFGSKDRKTNCTGIVCECSSILCSIISKPVKTI